MPVGKDGRWYGTDIEADYAGTQYDQDNRQAWADITHASGAGLLNNLDAQQRARRRAEEDRREALAEQANENYQECKEAIRQVFDFYRAGQIDKAVRCSLSAAAQKGRNDQLEKLELLAAVMLYKQGQYKEAINCGIPFVSSLCYEKLGEKQKASQAALQAVFFEAAPLFYRREFDSLNDYRLSKNTKFSDLCEGNTIWDDLNLPFDIELEEFLPIVFSRAEEGNEAFYKLAGDLYYEARGDLKTAKVWYDKAVSNNDPEALFFVGKCIKNGGLGYTKNKKLGNEYIKRSGIKVEDDDGRNGYLGLLFGIVGVVGLLSTTSLILAKVDFSSLISDFQFVMLPKIFIYLITLIAGIIITYKAWVWRKNILFIILLALSAIGWLSIFDITLNIDHLVKGKITFQSTAQINNEILSGLSYIENGVQKTVMIKNRWNNQVGTGIAGTPLLKNADGKINETKDRVKMLKKGDILTVTGKPIKDRVPVEHEGVKGFIPMEYIGLPEK